jgi:DNA-binding protein H-NS
MATLKQIQSRIEKLQAQAEGLIAKRAAVVIGEIRALMNQHGLTTADIDAHTPKKRGPKPKSAALYAAGMARPAEAKAKTKSFNTASKLPPKYRNPETGATWSGHARPPAWIKDAGDRSVFLIGKHSASDAAAKKGRDAANAKRTVARKAAAKKANGKTPGKTAKAVKSVRAKRGTATTKSAAV